MKQVRLVIDRLVLEGLELTPEQAESFRQGLAAALSTGLADAALLSCLSTTRLEHLRLPEISTSSRDPQLAGRLAGERLVQGLKPGAAKKDTL